MDIEFQKSDFAKLMFPIVDMPDDVDPVKFFKRLQRWEEYYNTKWPILKKNKVFRYIVLMYDKESPFRERITDLNQRKIEAARFVKLITDPKIVPGDIMDIMVGMDQKFNTMVIAYVRMHRDSKYALVVGLENLFYADLLKTQAGETPKKPIHETQENLENAIIELLNQDNSPQLKRELFEFMENERLSKYRPEGIADILSKGGNPFEGKEFAYDTY
jgi:hypothetical protein